MKKTFSIAALVFLLVALGGIANAENFVLKAGGVSLWLPDDWEIDSEEQEAALYADAPDGDSFCVLQVLPEVRNLFSALKTYGDALSEEIDDFVPSGEARRDNLHNIKTDFISGEGQRDYQAWSVAVALMQTEAGVLMCAVGWEKDKGEKFAPLPEKIFSSIQALK